jgi:DNA (cytosine-5)-methyltransferase 1
MSEAFPIADDGGFAEFSISKDPYYETEYFGIGDKVSKFNEAGAMQGGVVVTKRISPIYNGKRQVLGDFLVPENEVPEQFFIDDAKVEQWRYLKSSKKIPRKNKTTGHEYVYSEGTMAFPDNPDMPARTILTGEGGSGASRMKHIVQTESGSYRRLVPDELDQLQDFPKGWTGA